MHSSQERSPPGNSAANNPAEKRPQRSSRSLDDKPGFTPIPLERRDQPKNSHPHHPLVRNRREDLSGALREQMQSLTEQRDSLEKNIDSLELKSKGAERAKAAILANLSHEFRTPLNAIIGFSEMLLSEMHTPLTDVRQRDYVTNIQNSGLELLQLVESLLARADLMSQDSTPVPAAADLGDIAPDVCAALDPPDKPVES